MSAPTDTFLQTISQMLAFDVAGHSMAFTLLSAFVAIMVAIMVPCAIYEQREARRQRNQQALDNATRVEKRPGGLKNWR